MRRLFVACAGFALVLTGFACGAEGTVEGPQTYAVSVDTASPSGENVQFASFFPASLKVRPGDSIVFDNRSTQAPHTVSFGISADRSNQPPPALPDGAPNPVVFGGCYSETAPSATLSACPSKPGSSPDSYTGKGYWNSGFMVPSVAPSGLKKFTMQLSDGVSPGSYLYVCILHRPMVATIEVVARDEDRAAPADVLVQAKTEIDKAKDVAARVPIPETSLTGGAFKAVAGTGKGAIAVNRFFPETIEVKAGTKVSWYARSAFEPHTVTFGSKWHAGEDDRAAFPPGGASSGAQYSGGLANSGFVPAPVSGSDKPMYELIFAKAGEYAYVCVLHPEMEGVVRVT